MLCYQFRSQKYLGYYIFLIQQSKMSYYVGINVGMRCKLQPLKLQDVLTMTVIPGVQKKRLLLFDVINDEIFP